MQTQAKSGGPAFCAYGAMLVLAVVAYLRFLIHDHGFATPAKVPQDFKVYLDAWQMARQGLSPYRPDVFLTYKYSPGVLPWVGLLPSTPWSAWLVGKACLSLAWAMATVWSAREAVLARWSWRSVGLMFLGVVISWKGMIEALDYGQIESLLLLVSVVAAALWSRGQVAWAGAVIGLLPWIKLPWGLMVVPFLIAAIARRNLKSFGLGVGAVAFVVGVLSPWILFGASGAIEVTRDWIITLKTQPAVLFIDPANQSFWAAGVRYFGGLGAPWPSVASAVASVGLVAMLARMTWRDAGANPFSGWLWQWLLALLLINPLSWRWGSLLCVGVPWAWKSKRRSLVVLAVLLWLAQQNPALKWVGVGDWMELHLWSSITLFWLVLWLGMVRCGARSNAF